MSWEQVIQQLEEESRLAFLAQNRLRELWSENLLVTRRFTNVWRAASGTWQLIARRATHTGAA